MLQFEPNQQVRELGNKVRNGTVFPQVRKGRECEIVCPGLVSDLNMAGRRVHGATEKSI